jgi:hypothetical protein
MPGVIEGIVFAVLTSSSLTIGLAGSALAISAITGALTVGLSIGLSYLSSVLFAPKQPKPDDVQTSIKNPTSPRQRHYGRVKTSGPWVFCEAKDGSLHKVIALGTGELDAIEEIWVDDIEVSPDGSGDVDEDPFDGKLRILTRRGQATETHYSQLTDEFPEWDSSHVGHGIASLYAKQRAVKSSKVGDVFPSLAQTLYRVVARGAKVFNPVTEATAWSDNAAAVIRDYMTHPDGMRLPEVMFTTPQATAGWIAAYNRADQNIPLKAGGTEKAYRLWTTYTFDERPADVLGRMLACCDGRIIPTPDGGITLDIGTWAEPTVTIDEDTIVGFSELSRGRDIMSTANVISATFMSPDNDYQATDADRWVDEDDVADRGEIVSDKAFNASPSHGQTRRLMKLAAYRANPSWTGTIQCNLKALAAFGHRFVRIQYPYFDIDEVFEVVDFRFDIGDGNILQSVTLQVQSMPQEAYEWDAETEEGTAPIAEATGGSGYTETAGTLTVDIVRVLVGGVSIPYADLSWPAVVTESLVAAPQYKRSSSSSWIDIALPEEGATEVRSPALADDTYDFRYQLRKAGGGVVDSSLTVTESVVADDVAPAALTSFGATGGQLGHADFSIVTPADSHLHHINVYEVPTGVALDKNVHTKITIPAATGTSFGYVRGDATPVNLATNGDFAVGSGWTLAAGWTIGSNVLNAAAGSATTAQQSLAGSWTAGNYLRYQYEATRSAGQVLLMLTGGATSNGGLVTTTSTKRERIPFNTGNNTIGWIKDAAFVGTIDNLVYFKETPTCAPQGVWDYYPFPANVSDVEGPGATPVTGIVII